MKSIKGCLSVVVAGLLGFYGIGAHAQTSDAAAAAASTLSPAAAEVVRLSQQGVDDSVLSSYVNNAQTPFGLTSDDVIYLHDVGVSSAVITSMLNHDKATPAQTPAYNYDQRLYTPATPAPVAAPAQPAVMPAPIADQGPQPVYVNSGAPPDVNYFYNDLSPYGSWVDLEGYGWCWQPSVVVANHDWRPYCDSGHWVYTDSGWFWQSDYSWGWAPFHYGRWQHHPRAGWVWFPDRVWGPAWVTWRSVDDNCGWAPLPLRATFVAGTGFRFNGVSVAANFDFGLGADLFTFVAIGDLCQRNIRPHCLPPVQVTRVFNRTTVINNIVVENNRTIVNRGIPVERVRTATHLDLKPVVVRQAPAGVRNGTLAGARSGAGVFRQEPHAPPANVHVVAQKVDDSHPVIRHSPAVAPANVNNRPVANPVPNRNVSTPPVDNNRNLPRERTQLPNEPAVRQNPPVTPPNTPVQPRVSTPAVQPAQPRVATPTPVQTPAVQENRTPAVRTYQPPTTTVAPRPGVTTTPPVSEESNPHVYHPKGYQQGNQAHALPPEQPVIPVTHPTPPQSQIPTQPPANDFSNPSPKSRGH